MILSLKFLHVKYLPPPRYFQLLRNHPDFSSIHFTPNEECLAHVLYMSCLCLAPDEEYLALKNASPEL